MALPVEVISKLVTASNKVWTWGGQAETTPFTTFILVGSQSLGKSAIVERMIGFPMNVIKAERSTKRPLFVTLVHSPGLSQPRYYVRENPDAVEVEKTAGDVLEFIEAENAKVLTISHTPLTLRVDSADVPSMQFLDLPGLELNRTDGEEELVLAEIKKMIRDFAQKDNHSLVVLEKATTQYATSPIVKFLDDEVPNWKSNSMLALTFADSLYTQPAETTTEEAVRARLKDWKSNSGGLMPFFVCSMPSKAKGYPGRLQNLKAQSDKESQVVESAFEDGGVPEDLAPHIGFEKLKKEMHAKYTETCVQAFLKAFPMLQQCAQDRVLQAKSVHGRKRHLEANDTLTRVGQVSDSEWVDLVTAQQHVMHLSKEVHDLKQELSETEPEERMIILRDCLFDLGISFTKMIDNPDSDVLFNEEVTGRCGFDMQQEFKRYENVEGPGKRLCCSGVSMDHPVVVSFKAQELEDGTLQLVGGVAYDRACRAFLSALIQVLRDVRKDPKFCEDAVRNAMGAGSGPDGRMLTLDPPKARFAIAKYLLEVIIEPAAKWFIEYVAIQLFYTRQLAHHIWMQRGSPAAVVVSAEPHIRKLLTEMDVDLLGQMSERAHGNLCSTLSVLGCRSIPNLAEMLAPPPTMPLNDAALNMMQAILKSIDFTSETAEVADKSRFLSAFKAQDKNWDPAAMHGPFSLFRSLLARHGLTFDGFPSLESPFDESTLWRILVAIEARGCDYHREIQVMKERPGIRLNSELDATLKTLGKHLDTSAKNDEALKDDGSVKSSCPSSVSVEPTTCAGPSDILLKRLKQRQCAPIERLRCDQDAYIIASGFEYVDDMSGMLTVVLRLFFSKTVIDDSKEAFENPRKCEEVFCRVASSDTAKIPKVLTETLIEAIWTIGRREKFEAKQQKEEELKMATDDFATKRRDALEKLDVLQKSMQEEMLDVARRFSDVGFQQTSSKKRKPMAEGCHELAKLLRDIDVR
mmetsp:Transcript_125211/g.267269  ORF Transcript_125211/g.267269 Transcript_125211/m.267269 type:complete len:974 (-) Transcript_125211:104-3025(-)